MTLVQHHPARRRSHSCSFLLALLCLLCSACITTPPTGRTLFEDARGAVSLQPVADRSFQASHPVSLEPSLLAQVLSGVRIQERQRALQAVLSGSSSTLPVFAANEIQFLVPLLASALATAAPDQTVGFLITTRRPGGSLLESSTTETTAGSLYAYGSSLYFSLSQYRSAPARTNTESIAHRRLPDTSGLADHTLLFTPGFAQRSDHFHRPADSASTDKFLAIDYHLLQQASTSATAPKQAAPGPEQTIEPQRQDVPIVPPPKSPVNIQRAIDHRDDEVRTLKDLIIKKDFELDALQKELQSIRRQLDDQITRQDSQRRKNKPPSKP